jgi:hypothetical protein
MDYPIIYVLFMGLASACFALNLRYLNAIFFILSLFLGKEFSDFDIIIIIYGVTVVGFKANYAISLILAAQSKLLMVFNSQYCSLLKEINDIIIIIYPHHLTYCATTAKMPKGTMMTNMMIAR